MSTVVRVRPLERDAAGNRPAGEPSRLELTGCDPAPNTTSDISGRARDGNHEVLDLFCVDVDVDIVSTDQVEVDGRLYEVDGPPKRYRNPMTLTSGAVVTLWRGVG